MKCFFGNSEPALIHQQPSLKKMSITSEATIQFITEEVFKLRDDSLYSNEDYFCEITSYVNIDKVRENVKDQLPADAKILCVYAMSYRNPLINRNVINYRIPYTTPCFHRPEDAGSYYKTYGGNRVCVADYPVGECMMVFNTEETRQRQKAKNDKKRKAKKAKKTAERKTRICSICATPTRNLCNGCRKIYYCSTECQSSDWKKHKKICSC